MTIDKITTVHSPHLVASSIKVVVVVHPLVVRPLVDTVVDTVVGMVEAMVEAMGEAMGEDLLLFLVVDTDRLEAIGMALLAAGGTD